MQKIVCIIKGIAIWIFAFFVLNIANAIIFPLKFAEVVVPLSLFVSTIISSKLSPIHDLFGRGWRTFLSILRYISDFAWMFFVMMGIFDILHFDVISIPVCLSSMFFSLLVAYFANRAELKAAYKYLEEISPPRNKSTQPQKPIVSPEVPHTTKVSRPATRSTTMPRIDKMEGHDFERFCADLLRRNGYQRVEVTRGSGDQGVDIIAYKDGKKYAIQCKRYSQKLGNKPVQEVHTGKTIYRCDVAAVMTNNYFTPGAMEAARAVGVELWDRNVLAKMLRNVENTA